MSAEIDIRVVQDRGCLSAAKFFYYFSSPISHELTSGFDGCEVALREFSRTVPFAKDLLSIRSPGEFRAEFIVGGSRAVVYFEGSAEKLPLEAMDSFARRLRGMGYGRIDHSSVPGTGCGNCPAGALKGCSSQDEARPRFVAVVKPPSVGSAPLTAPFSR